MQYNNPQPGEATYAKTLVGFSGARITVKGQVVYDTHLIGLLIFELIVSHKRLSVQTEAINYNLKATAMSKQNRF
ncbi:hypothetical protein GCM10009426_35610 [Rheinheimera tangshanensis]|nr:hypothetical protein GCM10010920_09920 [Rheinheimera tangshanensis]